MANTKNKTKNKSIFGVIAFLFKIMDRRDKLEFVFLTFMFALSGFFKLLPTQITAMLVSLIAGEEVTFFGIHISNEINLTLIIILSAVLAFTPGLISNTLGYFKNKFALRILLKTKQVAFSWATTPRKNLNLGMTIGDATYRINDSVTDIEFVLETYFDTILPQAFMAVMSAVFVCVMEIWSMPVLLGGLVVSFSVFLVRQKVEIPVTTMMERNSARVTNYLVNSLENLTIINLSMSQSLEQGLLKNRTDDYLNSSKKRFKIWSVYWIVNSLIDVLCTYSIILICSGRVSAGTINASDIVIIIGYVANVFSPIQNFGWFLNSSTQLMTKINRLKELKPTKNNTLGVVDNYDKPIKKITLQGVRVINDNNTIIDNISYSLEAGKLNVITGESGGGKTTSLRAILGIAEKEAGDIILNDEYTVKSMYSFIDRFAVVMQSPFIFNRDVKNNVYYPNIIETKDTKEIIKTLKMSRVINKKFDEDSEQEMQYKLSGGEKKRICVLRGLLQNKEVYVFDEPTNELDNENSMIILDQLNKLKENAIVMVVTHDKRIIDKADKIITVNNRISTDEDNQ